MDKFKITFLPDKKTVEVAKDTTVLSAALSAGVYINSACGGDGVCGRCRVNIKIKDKFESCLACLTAVHADMQVEVPAESRLDYGLKEEGIFSQAEEIEAEGGLLQDKIFKHSPLATKIYLELPKPSLEDNASDLDRLFRSINSHCEFSVMQTGLFNIRHLAELLRDSEWKVTVTLGDRNGAVEVVLVEPGDTSGRNFGMCFDIGTTTVSGQLVNLNSKVPLGAEASYNKQAVFGADVISRIVYARQEQGLEKLHNALAETMNQIIMDLIVKHKVDLNDVTCVVCAGNPTMIHLLLRIDPSYIRRDPYIPTANFPPVIRAAEAGVNINPRGLLSCMPGVASYVGADTTAGVISCGLYKENELSVLIDIGTNGEIALGNREFIVACAASAGPAFEGSGVSCGMRSSRGAVQKAHIDIKNKKVGLETIGGAPALGICGTGYIDLIASLLSHGLIDRSGKFDPKGFRVRQGDSGLEFVVASKEECGAERDIVITEADIENLKRSKAAIYSAVSVLARHMNFQLCDIRKFFIAGAFGTSLDIESSVKIGLLPDLDRSRFEFIGNSALAGARLALVSTQAKALSEQLARSITYFELSTDPGYMDEYMSAMFFPHTDLKRFPSV